MCQRVSKSAIVNAIVIVKKEREFKKNKKKKPKAKKVKRPVAVFRCVMEVVQECGDRVSAGPTLSNLPVLR